MSYLRQGNKLLVIIGPSGVGKSSVIRRLNKQNVLEITPTWTTRPPRPDELSGAIEHHFVAQKEFANKESQGFFLETIQMFGLPYWYGLPKVLKPKAGRVPLIMLRATLLSSLDKYYSTYIVYQIEDSLEKTKERQVSRQIAGQKLGTRLKDYQKEITLGRKLANRVFYNNKSLDLLAKDIKSALIEDRLLSLGT